MVEQLVLAAAEGGLVGQLEEVADDLASLPIEPAEGESHLRQTLEHHGVFLAEHEAREMNLHRRPKPGADVGWTRGKITELRVKCECKSLSQFGVQPVHLAIGGLQREPRMHPL